MVWLQTNVVATLVDAGKLRAAIIAGGGVVNVRREITYSFPVPTLIFTSTMLPLPPPFPFDTTVTSTETAMSLNAGGVVDYEMTKHLRVGVDARYMHAFLDQTDEGSPRDGAGAVAVLGIGSDSNDSHSKERIT